MSVILKGFEPGRGGSVKKNYPADDFLADTQEDAEHKRGRRGCGASEARQH